MKTICLIAFALTLPLPALAADVTAPVRAVMEAAEANWADPPQDYQDYFSEERLSTLYSADFAARYRKAAETPFAKEMGTPFDYDVIVNGQDGCPLKNIKIAQTGVEGGAAHVVASFQGTTCFGPGEEFQIRQEAHFLVVEVGGHAAIDDIVTPMDGEPTSLKAQMDEIAAGAE